MSKAKEAQGIVTDTVYMHNIQRL